MKYARFDQSSWPVPNDDDLERRLRYSERVSVADALTAASVVSAYKKLLNVSQVKRNLICGKIKAARGKP
jgi:hypothetical protein